MSNSNPRETKWQCPYCGSRKTSTTGKPADGLCSGKPKDKNGRMQPHSWKKVG